MHDVRSEVSPSNKLLKGISKVMIFNVAANTLTSSFDLPFDYIFVFAFPFLFF